MQATYLESRAFHENELTALRDECEETRAQHDALRQQHADVKNSLQSTRLVHILLHLQSGLKLLYSGDKVIQLFKLASTH